MNAQIWHAVCGPFCLPVSIHKCLPEHYENIDVDEAGCKLCGAIHKCGTAKCVLSEQEGYKVCEITGYCVCNKVWSNNEFVDTVAHLGEAYQPQLQTVDPCMVEYWVEDMLMGHRSVLESEIHSNRARRTIVLTRIFKHYKIHHKPLNLVDVLTCLINSTNNLREPLLLEHDELRPIVSHCINVIVGFCGKLFAIKSAVPSSVKMHGFVVGVLYLVRTGLVINDSVELLPRVPVLQYLLPAETQLRRVFGLSTRIMTETENMIKKTLKNMSASQLRNIGFV